MREFKSIFIFLVIVAIIIAVSYWAYNKGYFKPVASETNKNVNVSNTNSTNNTKNTTNNTTNTNSKEENTNIENNENEEEYVGKEEVDQTTTKEEEKKNETIENKAIEAVKKAWWGDASAIFVVDNSNTSLSSDEMMVKITVDGAQYFYIYNIKTGAVKEF